jgi:hypothetical protein
MEGCPQKGKEEDRSDNSEDEDYSHDSDDEGEEEEEDLRLAKRRKTALPLVMKFLRTGIHQLQLLMSNCIPHDLPGALLLLRVQNLLLSTGSGPFRAFLKR